MKVGGKYSVSYNRLPNLERSREVVNIGILPSQNTIRNYAPCFLKHLRHKHPAAQAVAPTAVHDGLQKQHIIQQIEKINDTTIIKSILFRISSITNI